MSANRVAQRYAKSLLELAQEQGVLEQARQDMKLISDLCQTSRQLVGMLRSPIIRPDKKYQVLQALLKGKTHPLTDSIVKLLAKKNREKILPEIAECFHYAYNDFKQIAEATVSSARPLDASLEATLKGIVKEISRRQEVVLKKKENASLIGGFILDVDDMRIDASVSNKLHQLQAELNQQ